MSRKRNLKFASFGDAHLTARLPHTPVDDSSRIERLIKFINHAFNLIVKNKIDFLIDTGDTSHDVLLDADSLDLLMLYIELSRVSQIPNIRVSGNHEIDGTSHVMQFLNRFTDDPKIFYFNKEPAIYEFDHKDTRIVAVPYCPDPDFIDYAEQGMIKEKDRKEYYNILVAHVGIQNTYHAEREAFIGVPLSEIERISKGYDLMFFGHHHAFQAVCDNGMYTGSIQQTRIDEINSIPGFVLTKMPDFKITHVENKYSPRFVILEDYELDYDLIKGNIVKPMIDVNNKTEEENRQYIKEVMNLEPYNIIRPRLKKIIETKPIRKAENIDDREGVIRKVIKDFKLKKSDRKEIEKYAINLYREVSSHGS